MSGFILVGRVCVCLLNIFGFRYFSFVEFVCVLVVVCFIFGLGVSLGGGGSEC